MKLQKRPPGSDTEKFAPKLGGGSDSGGGGVVVVAATVTFLQQNVL